jgi:hypothetical protein
MTLPTLLNTLRILLADPHGLRFGDELLADCARLALAELSQCYGNPLMLTGLDGATQTTLDMLDEQTLVCGAAAHALRAQAASRADLSVLNQANPQALLQSASHYQEVFARGLAAATRRKRASAGYAVWTIPCQEDE